MTKTILVVDDSPTERFMTVDILTKAGYQVLTAENAEEGISKAKAMHPDLIVMDVVMPGMNGYQATRTLKRNADTKDIPIIVCTSKGQETDKIWGMRQGASDYLVKPVQAKELLKHVSAVQKANPIKPVAKTPPKPAVAPAPVAKPAATPAPVATPAPAAATPAPVAATPAPTAAPPAPTAAPPTPAVATPAPVAPPAAPAPTATAAPAATPVASPSPPSTMAPDSLLQATPTTPAPTK